MHGLLNKAIEVFVIDRYGLTTWDRIAAAACLDPPEFEAMACYADTLTDTVLQAASDLLERPRATLLEDLGIHLISDPKFAPLRRLLRFGGAEYDDFLHSLDDLPGRVQLAVPELALPRLELQETAPGQFELLCHPGLPGFSHLLLGLLRTMADEYGALVLLEHDGVRHRPDGTAAEVLRIALSDHKLHPGRAFSLTTGTSA